MCTTASAVMTLTDAELEALVTRPPAGARPDDARPSAETGLLTIEELLRQSPSTVADAGDRPSGQAHGRLVTGAPTSTGSRPASPRLADGAARTSRPLAPPLETLVRFAATAEELGRLRGRFAECAERWGPQAAAEAGRRLLTAFEDETGGGLPPYWVMTALLRPQSLIVEPQRASGLALDLPARLLDQEFGRGGVWRFEEVDFPSVLVHAPTRRFLRETGLPERGVLFRLEEDCPLARLADYRDEQRPAAVLPAGAERYVRLGRLAGGGSVVIDGAEGAVLYWNERTGALLPLHTDVSTLAFTLWLLHHERARDARVDHARALSPYGTLAALMVEVLAAVDPTVTPSGHQDWREALRAETRAVLASTTTD